MKWILYVILLIVVLIGAIFLVGYALPAKTTTSRSITLHQPPAAVFAVLVDVQHMADWNRNTEKVEMLPPTDGRETTKQTFKGGMTMTIITAKSSPPQHLVRSLDDDGGPFVGSWNYEITPVDGGSRVVLTEVAIFTNPFFRVMTRVFGATKYMDEHLEDLARKLGETAQVG
ncbi:MAG: SRPBCC family protein [Verrucomicrobiota bacterium]|nr:SRPBCC family protein [Verrucomicrobiota bacterium]